MKKAYTKKTFRTKSVNLLAIIDRITTDYMSKGYTLTVRQCYYQLVAGGYIPNTQNSYQAIAALINDGRMAGLIDWDAIEDRTRYTRSLSHWSSAAEMIYTAARSYRMDKRADQPVYIEAWIEKDALIGVVEQTANKYDVPCFSCRGYPSISALREAAQRFMQESDRERRVILYAGDHDPSGLDIPRSIQESLETFGADVEVIRIGLTKEQIDAAGAPPNPAKDTDKRYKKYVQEHGGTCWELDALDPETLSNLYAQSIDRLTDWTLYKSAVKEENAGRQTLLAAYQNWTQIESYLD